jgi:hypothetical protein
MEYLNPAMPFGGGAGQQPSPWFTVANQFVPRNLHDVIRWARYITIQSPTTSEVIRKLATYPITDFLIDTEQEGLKTRYEEVLKSFKLKELLQDAGFEFFTIGNVFMSIYFPIHRELVCPSCKAVYNVKKAPWATFKQWNFHGKCPNDKCSHQGIFTRLDSKSLAVEDMNLIKWTPEHIAVSHNPITGESEYYYRIPNNIKLKIQKGDRLFVDSTPWSLIEAVRFNQDFKFDKGSLFHLKNISSGGTVEGISVPPLLSLFSLVFYQATLRKANEAIATDYLNPMRVVFPQAQTANSDPVVSMSLRNFRTNMEDALRRHKVDKNQFVIAPTPVGYTPIGGEGKNLLVAAEIDQAEESILLSLGVSKDLLSGTTNWTSSSVGLRMMENLLTSYIGRLQDMIDWITSRVAAYLTMESVKVSLIPFKLLDDEILKQLLLQLAQLGKASDKTLFEELGLDWSEEQEHIKNEATIRAKMAVETEYEVGEAQFVAARGAGEKMAENEEYQNILMEAQTIAGELLGADENARRTILGELKVQEYAMYVMVNQLIKEAEGVVDPNDPNAQKDPNVPPGQQPGGKPAPGAAGGKEEKTAKPAAGKPGDNKAPKDAKQPSGPKG